jgi:hypothetical protein
MSHPDGGPAGAPGPLPDLFVGRTHEGCEAAAFLAGNQSVSIVGPGQIGKTALVRQLMRAAAGPVPGPDAGGLFVFLDCAGLGEGGHEAVYRRFAAEMAAALGASGLPPEPALDAAAAAPTRLSFESAVRRLNQRGLRVILALDAFERLSASRHLDLGFLNALRAAAARHQLAFLVTSRRPLIELTYAGREQDLLSSPFFNIFATVPLGLLPEDEARQLVRELARAAGTT